MSLSQSSSTSISKTEHYLWLLLFGLLLLGYLLNLGIQPLYLEEPRRAFIAMEMLENKNWIVPTLWGQYYYFKPPLFNWILLASTGLLGGFSEYALRFPTVVSTWLLSGLLYLIGRKQLGERHGRYAAALWLCSVGVLFYFSMIAEIDLFFSLLTFCSIYAIYYFYQKQQLWTLFLVVYTLSALAFLSKGLPALVFTGVSLLTFFIWKKKFWKLFHPAHFTGFALLILLVGGYFYGYSFYNPPKDYLLTLLAQSSERTFLGAAWFNFLKHLFLFPLDFAKELLPALFLLPFLINKSSWESLRQHEFLTFCALMLVFNLVPYWLSPGTRMRYVYMLLPFGIFILVGLWKNMESQDQNTKWPQRLFLGFTSLPVVLLPLGSLAILFVPDLDFLSYRWFLSIGTFLIFCGLAYGFFRFPQWRMLFLLCALAIGRILFDLSILPQRVVDSGAQRNKAFAYELFEEIGNNPLTIVGDEKILSYTSTFYLDRLRKKVIRAESKPVFQSGHYYIISVSDIPAAAKILHTYEYEDAERAIILME